METPEINIAEILKDCPKEMPLYSVVHGEVKLSEVTSQGIFVTYYPKNRGVLQLHFFEDGKYSKDGECVLFPSKDQRDWSRFEPPVKPPFAVNKNLCEYYAFDMFGRVKLLTNEHNSLDNKLWSFGNRFDTGEQAEYAAEKVKELLLSLRKEK